MNLAGYEVRMGAIRNADNSTGWQTLIETPILRPRHSWEYDIKLKCIEIGWKGGQRIWMPQASNQGGNLAMGSIQDAEFLGHLGNNLLQ
jgi:hypothetical protein